MQWQVQSLQGLEDCSGQRYLNPEQFTAVPRGDLHAGMGTQHQPATSHHPWKSLGQSPMSWAILGHDLGGSKTGRLFLRALWEQPPVFDSNVGMGSTTLVDLKSLNLGLRFVTRRALKTPFPMGINLHCYGINI